MDGLTDKVIDDLINVVVPVSVFAEPALKPGSQGFMKLVDHLILNCFVLEHTPTGSAGDSCLRLRVRGKDELGPAGAFDWDCCRHA